VKRIKHNDLTHYFLRPHEELPQAYLASCEKFFKEISRKHQAPSGKINWFKKKFDRDLKLQAASSKPQASSLEELDPTIDWNKLIR
jgi:hypothetical protein